MLLKEGNDAHRYYYGYDLVFSIGIIDKTGKQIIPCIYNSIERVPNGFLCYADIYDERLEENWDWNEALNEFYPYEDYILEYLDNNGNFIAEGIMIKNSLQTCDEANSIAEELYVINRNGEYLFFDKTGNELHLGDFLEVSDFKDGLSYVSCIGEIIKKGEKINSRYEKDGIVYHVYDCYIDKNGTQFWED